MIDYIHGRIDVIEPQFIVVESYGVGYQIFCPNPFVFQKEQDDTVKVFTYHYVREDLMRLYGFQTRKEKTLFEKLLNVSGIGPKGALAILASGQPEHLITAIEEENERFLVKFPGVGKKTARQMILDLKGKLEEFAPNLFGMEEGLRQTSVHTPLHSKELNEALEALQALGYTEKELTKITPLLKEDALTTDQYIKKALQLMLNQ